LIGFIHLPGHHDGEHLAHAFLHVIDRIRAAKKVSYIQLFSNSQFIHLMHKLGWVTLDNAPNNDTFMLWAEMQLRRRGIPFSKTERRIR
jgi:hypothetical protein